MALSLHPWNPDWLVPDWPAPKQVKAVCTTRAGGTSDAPWDTMNLGTHVGDAMWQVQSNRNALRRALGAKAVFMDQVHGTQVESLSQDRTDGLKADGAWTEQSGLVCTVMVADCLPVLLCDTQGTRVAALHAGWRGLAGQCGWGILEAGHKKLMSSGPADIAQAATELIAWMGPCIGPDAFEVGEQVRAAFVQDSTAGANFFKPLGQGKWLADLAGLARQRLNTLGVQHVYGNDGGAQWCTVSNPSRFFSHRRDRISGRQAACIWLE